MMIEKNKVKQKRLNEIEDFKHNYVEDLVHKWTINNSQEYNDRFVKIEQLADFK